MLSVDVVTLYHSIQSLAIDREQTRRCLFVSTSMLKHARHVAAFYYRQCDPLFLFLSCRFAGTTPMIAHAVRQIGGPHRTVAHSNSSDHRSLELTNVSGPVILLQQRERLSRERHRRAQRIHTIG